MAQRGIIAPKVKDFFKTGEIVFREGEDGNEMYIIQTGKVEVLKSTGDEEVVLATLEPKAFFGEMALISEKPRNASTQAAEETEAFKLNKDDFINLVSSSHGMASRISDEFLRRYKINDRAQKEQTG